MTPPPVVLIIDDDALVHEFLREVIPTTTGCRTLHASSLREARQFLDQDVPSLLLIDGSLPDGRSEDFVREISKDPRWCAVPKWFLSGACPPGWDGSVWKAFGVEGFLLKPVPLDRLIQVVKEAMRERPVPTPRV